MHQAHDSKRPARKDERMDVIFWPDLAPRNDALAGNAKHEGGQIQS